MLGHETHAGRAASTSRGAREVREISERFGFDVDPDALVEDLPVGVQQRVEIIKALSATPRCSSSTSRPPCSPRRRPTS